MKVIQKITLLKYNIGLQVKLYAKERCALAKFYLYINAHIN